MFDGLADDVDRAAATASPSPSRRTSSPGRRSSRRRRRSASTRTSDSPRSARAATSRRWTAATASGSYTVTALIAGRGQRRPASSTGGAPRAAAPTYPDEIKALYLAAPRGTLGPNALKLKARSRERDVPAPRSTSPSSSSTELQSSTYLYADRRPRPAVCGHLDGRVLRDVQEGVLPVLRADDGGRSCATSASRPGSPRGSCPGRATRPGDRADPVQQRPRLGRGLLPGLRLGRRSTRPAATSASSRRCRPGPRPRAARRGRSRARRVADGRSATERRRPGRRTAPPVACPGGPARSARWWRSMALLLLIVGGVAFLAWQRGPRGATTRGRRLRDGHPDRVAVRVRAAARPDRLRVRGRRWARSCPTSDPSWRRWPGPRSSRSMPARCSAPSGSRACRAAQRRLRVASCGSPSGARNAAAAALDGAPRAAPVARARRSGFVPPGRARRRFVASAAARWAVRLWARRTGRPARNSMTRDPAQVHRPHPEPVERQVEQGQQRDLEDAVVADHDRPRVVRDGVARSRRPAGGRACRAPGPRASRARIVASAGRTRAATSGRDSPPGAQAVERGSPPGRQLCRRSALRSRRDGGPASRPGGSRGSPGRAARDGHAGGAGSRARSPRRSGSCARAGSGRARAGAGRDRQCRRVVRRGEPLRDERRLAPPDRRSAASRPGPGSGPRR